MPFSSTPSDEVFVGAFKELSGGGDTLGAEDFRKLLSGAGGNKLTDDQFQTVLSAVVGTGTDTVSLDQFLSWARSSQPVTATSTAQPATISAAHVAAAGAAPAQIPEKPTEDQPTGAEQTEAPAAAATETAKD